MVLKLAIAKAYFSASALCELPINQMFKGISDTESSKSLKLTVLFIFKVTCISALCDIVTFGQI